MYFRNQSTGVLQEENLSPNKLLVLQLLEINFLRTSENDSGATATCITS